MPSQEDRDAMRAPTGLTGPGKELSEAMRDKIRQLQAARSQAEAAGTGPSRPVAPLAHQVNRVIEQREGLCHLCGEMLATLSLPQNQALMTPDARERFAGIIEGWKRRFEKCSGEA